MKCSKCYKEIPNDSKQCPICGNIFASFFEEIKLTSEQKLKLVAHKILFPSIVIFLMLTIIVYATTSYNTKLSRITDVNKLVKDETSENYLNDLYISDGRYYKYILNKTEKEIYDKIIDAIKKHEENVQLNISDYKIKESHFTTQTMRKLKDVISMDHPEIIELGFVTQTVEDANVKIIIRYILDEEEKLQAEEQIIDFINKIKENTQTKQEYEKIKYIYEILNAAEFSNDIEANSAYGCLILKKCNDQGYSKSAQILFHNLKINSMIAIGQLNNRHHEWNIVKYENKYYYFDEILSGKKGQLIYKGLLFKDKNYKVYYKKLIPIISNRNINVAS